MLINQCTHILLHFVKTVHFLIISHKHVRINFVNEYFVCNLLFDTVSSLNNVSEFGACVLVITGLGINHVDQCSTLTNSLVICSIVLFEFLIAWEVFDIKLDIGIIIDFMVINVSGWGQEERLVR